MSPMARWAFRPRLALLTLALAGSLAGATVVPPPPPYERDIFGALQGEVTRRFGDEMHKRIRWSIGSIVVSGSYRSSADKPFNLLLRDQRGWTSWRSGAPRAVAPALSAELDRLLAGDLFWQEQGFVYGQPCPGRGRVMSVHYRGRDERSRQPCGPIGIAGRLADIAATEQLPPGAAPDAGGRSEMIRGARGSDYENRLPTPADPDAAGLVLFLAMQSAYALRDGDVARHVEAYADDVTVTWPTGTEKGKESLRRRARADIWNGVERRHVTPGEAYVRQTGPESFVFTGTYSYWHNERESYFPVTSRWEKRRGIWEIVHQEVGPEKLVSDPKAAAAERRPGN